MKMEGISPLAHENRAALIAIKIAHTAIWAFFVGCILTLPVMALQRRLDWAILLTVFISVECGVLALNNGRCPLTNVAARFTSERSDNFDIYLPRWLARWNKTIFGSFFLAGVLLLLWCGFH